MSNPLSAPAAAIHRKWPAIPQPANTLASLQLAVSALKARSHIQSREADPMEASFVTVQDLLNLGLVDANGRTIIDRLEAIEARLDALEAAP